MYNIDTMKISDFFPVPSYLRMPAIGLDISDKSLKYIEFRRKGKTIELLKYDRKAIPKDIIESGLIKKTEEFIQILKNFRKEIKNYRLIAALPEEKVFIGRVELPLMKNEEIRDSLALQIEEHIPLKADEAIFDYEIDETSSKKENHLDVFFTATPIAVAKSYRDTLTEAGFYPVAFETEPHALTRALIKPEEKNTQMILDFGKTRTSFIIATGQKVELSWTIKVAGEAIDAEISKIFSIGAEEAGRLKNRIGLSRKKENEKIFNAVMPIVSAIKNEAYKHMSFWKTHIISRNNADGEIKKIILCGGDSNLTGLSEYLSDILNLPVELGNPWINIAFPEDYIPEIEFKESLMYSTAIGLALRKI